MSWHYSQALVAAYSEACCSDGKPYAQWRSIPIALDDSCSAKMKDIFHRSPYGMMFVLSTDVTGKELLTWFLEVSHVKTLVRLEKEQGLTEREVDCGMNLRESSEKSSRRTCLLKTRNICGLTDLSEFSKTLPAWGMMQGGVCSELTTYERHTSAKGCGFLPTPTTIGNELAPSMKKHRYHRNLLDFLGKNRILPTKGNGGQLIALREWMLGWPIGWTGSEPLGTDKFLHWFRWFGEY